MKKTYLTLTLFLCLTAMPLYAGIILPDNADFQYSGDTSLGDIFNRPVGNGNAAPVSLSPDADAVGYDAFSFEVTTQGIYSLEVSVADFGFSTYLFLYQTSFDPAAPLADILLGESNLDTTSSLTATLFSNTLYIAVTTGFSNFDEGAYGGEIKEIAPLVPEPSTFILISGIALFPVFMRRLKPVRQDL